MWPFKPKLPIIQEDKEWIEVNLLWLKEQFGHHVDPITPTPDHFPMEFMGSKADAHRILSIVCGRMGTPTDNIELRFFDPLPMMEDFMLAPEETDTPEGIYHRSEDGKHIIELNRQQLPDFDTLVATIAHEAAHIKLLTLGDPEEDEEYLTDLTAIYFGFGIFIGNSAFKFSQWQDGSHQGWSSKRSGYLPEQVIAYAMATLYPEDDWITYLTNLMGKYVKQSHRFISTTHG
ncbi:hypothetical protein [Parapedobacter sp. 10938]|uniref:hypothetical protein n=1 Tax=Parapedobacter flavus TaxID=3110225 RepID=UPI002DBBEF3D|nr:hypothetical protein [Parapedobacter sp. 10938]MEC3882077.1 hypothetical protein [Parapedobacter sp. 10938]